MSSSSPVATPTASEGLKDGVICTTGGSIIDLCSLAESEGPGRVNSGARLLIGVTFGTDDAGVKADIRMDFLAAGLSIGTVLVLAGEEVVSIFSSFSSVLSMLIFAAKKIGKYLSSQCEMIYSK